MFWRKQRGWPPETRDVCVLAAELHGHLPVLLLEDARERFPVINQGLAALIPAIEAAGGLVEINDSTTVTGLWNAASDHADAAVRALKAALAAEAAVAAADQIARGETGATLAVRIGIACGRAAVGFAGTARHGRITALGAPVIEAGQLKALAKNYGCAIVATGEAVEAAGGRFICRELDEVVVWGRTEPVTVFQVQSERTTASAGEEA